MVKGESDPKQTYSVSYRMS